MSKKNKRRTISCNTLSKGVAPAKYLKFDDKKCEAKFVDDDYDREAAYKWFKVKKTQVEMMRDRRLEIPEDEHFFLAYDPKKESLTSWEDRNIRKFVEIYRNKAEEEGINFNSTLSNVYYDVENDINTVVVYLCRERESASITADEFKTKFYYYRNKYYVTNRPLKMIFISEVTLNKKEETAEKLNFISCQFFLTENLKFNLTHHKLYPKHRLLNEEERRKVLETIRPEQLPQMHQYDPVRRYFDWPLGSIVEIDRDEKYMAMPAPKSKYYRRIVA